MKKTKRIVFALVLALALLLPCVLPAAAIVQPSDSSNATETVHKVTCTENGGRGTATPMYPSWESYEYTAQASGYITFDFYGEYFQNVTLKYRIYVTTKDGTRIKEKEEEGDFPLLGVEGFSFKYYVKYTDTLTLQITMKTGSAAGSSAEPIQPSDEFSPSGVVVRNQYEYTYKTGPFFFAQHAIQPGFNTTNLEKTTFPKADGGYNSLPIYYVNNPAAANTSLLSREGCPLISSAMVLRNMHKTSKLQLHDVRTNTTGYVLPDPYTVMMMNLVGKQKDNQGAPDYTVVNDPTVSGGKRYEIANLGGDPTSANFYTIAAQFGVKCFDSKYDKYNNTYFHDLSATGKAQVITNEVKSHKQSGVIIGLRDDDGATHFIVVVGSTYAGQQERPDLLEKYFTVIDSITALSKSEPEQLLSQITTKYKDLDHVYRLIYFYE